MLRCSHKLREPSPLAGGRVGSTSFRQRGRDDLGSTVSNHVITRAPFLGLVALKGDLEHTKKEERVPLGYQVTV